MVLRRARRSWLWTTSLRLVRFSPHLHLRQLLRGSLGMPSPRCNIQRPVLQTERLTPSPPSRVGGSATAAGDLVKQLGGELIGYLFILEIPGLNGRDKLDDVPVSILIENP